MSVKMRLFFIFYLNFFYLFLSEKKCLLYLHLKLHNGDSKCLILNFIFMADFRYIVCEDSGNESKFLFGTNDLEFARDYVFLEVSTRSTSDFVLFHIVDSKSKEFVMHLGYFPQKSM